jgi:tetratricopeptide (TPR) repeat protein
VNTAHIDELDRIEMDDGFVWRPIRRRFGIQAFGVNAYTPREAGAPVVEEHTENQYGHEEIYLVLRGRALFTVDGNEHELGPGQLVFLRDPSLKRGAIGLTEDTVVLAVGGKPGVAHEPSAWEAMFAAVPASREGNWEEAIRISEEALADQPDNPGLLYNLACFESRGKRPLQAIEHLSRAIELEPKWREFAAKDVDFDPIRREPGFPVA